MKNRTLSNYLLVTLKGIAMGAADVIPGVSGGTIAFITGIYQELIDSIKAIDIDALKLLFKGKFSAFWKKINGTFLLALIAGIGISIFSLAKLMQYLLEVHPVQVWSFFFGLIVASIFYIVKGIDGKKKIHAIPVIIGIAVGATICLISPSQTTEALWFIFLCGSIAICAMILPGISGSFILLLLGKYAFVMDAVGSLNLKILLIFAVGAVCGIVLFSRFLSWLMKNYNNGTLFFLSGLMAGSLIKVWPWKQNLASGVDRPVFPAEHFSDPNVYSAVIWAAIGLAIVFVIEYIGKKLQKADEAD